MKLLHVVGARPNFPKLAPVFRAAQRLGYTQRIVHTGQHYDHDLSGAFFNCLDLPAPDYNLGVGSSSHAVQTARIMIECEKVFSLERPDWVVVYGDVNSTLAATLVAAKMRLRVAHVEAGLRSGDWDMPEEVNRVVVDRISDLLLTPSRDANRALLREGVSRRRICFVGNVMADSVHFASRREDLSALLSELGLSPDSRPVVVTLHRPSNVDDPSRLRRIAVVLETLARKYTVVFPMHPRTRLCCEHAGVVWRRVVVLKPLPYSRMLAVVRSAKVVITDSGGLQEETTVLGVPCLTLRKNTERPITIRQGTNRLVPEPEELIRWVQADRPKARRQPEGWDGAAGERIVRALARWRTSLC